MAQKSNKLNWSTLTPEERRKVRERRTENLELGSYNHSTAPYGYIYVQDKYGYRMVVPDKTLAPIIHGAYVGVASAEINSAAELSDFLTKKLGKKFYPSTAMNLLQDGRYMGWYRLPPSLGGKHKKATNFTATIVSEDLFVEAVFRTLQEGW